MTIMVAVAPATNTANPSRIGIQGLFSMRAEPRRGAKIWQATATDATLANKIVLLQVSLCADGGCVEEQLAALPRNTRPSAPTRASWR